MSTAQVLSYRKHFGRELLTKVKINRDVALGSPSALPCPYFDYQFQLPIRTQIKRKRHFLNGQ